VPRICKNEVLFVLVLPPRATATAQFVVAYVPDFAGAVIAVVQAGTAVNGGAVLTYHPPTHPPGGGQDRGPIARQRATLHNGVDNTAHSNERHNSTTTKRGNGTNDTATDRPTDGPTSAEQASECFPTVTVRQSSLSLSLPRHHNHSLTATH